MTFEVTDCMKTNTKHNLKKIFLGAVLVGILFSNQACQVRQHSAHLHLLDEVRRQHAGELIGEKSEEITKAFKGDRQFAVYIKKYLQKKNSKIDSAQLARAIIRLSETHSYDPVFLLAVIKTESSFRAQVVGSAGEIGLMQLKPDTAEWISRKSNIEWLGPEALKDPEYNVLLGAQYFQYLKGRYKSESLKYINAYNVGLTSLNRMPAQAVKKHPYFGKVIQNYLAIYKELKKIKKIEGVS